MNKLILNRNIVIPFLLLFAGMMIFFTSSSFSEKNKFLKPANGTLKIIFINTANGKPIVLRDSLYNNYFGEQYSISKLKYYISNLNISENNRNKDLGGYYLMNAAAAENNIELSLEPGNYSSLQFLLGVDSIKNCSGAQSGALDPMNDMFWTWNTGYVMFKLEGTSPVSTADLQRLEYHIGGYKGVNNVATKINFNFTNDHRLQIKSNSTTEVTIETNVDNFWHGTNEVKISEVPIWMTMGGWAKKIAANFSNLFSVKSIRNIP